MTFVFINTSNEAEMLADRVIPRLQHANSAIILTAVKVILYLTNYISNDSIVDGLFKKLSPPLSNYYYTYSQ
jgi:AP-2 complex subunit beta-1